jgi:cation diffusion facilitator family transporter
VSHGNSRRAIVAALAANAGIAVAKFVGFLITGASSMLSESVHSLADTANQGLLLLGQKQAARRASDLHQYGYGKERYFWSFVVALVLFSLGSAFSLYEGWHKLNSDHHELESAGVGIAILLVAVVLESLSFRTAVAEARHEKSAGDSWARFIRRTRVPELAVVLLEDFGALVGLVLALAGVSLSLITGDAVWDGVATVCIGVLLGVIALALCIEMRSMLLGEAAADTEREKIAAALQSTSGVERLINFRTMHLSPDEVLLTAKIEVAPHLLATQVADVVDAAEAAVRSAVPIAKLIYLEPAIFDPDREEIP